MHFMHTGKTLSNWLRVFVVVVVYKYKVMGLTKLDGCMCLQAQSCYVQYHCEGLCCCLHINYITGPLADHDRYSRLMNE